MLKILSIIGYFGMIGGLLGLLVTQNLFSSSALRHFLTGGGRSTAGLGAGTCIRAEVFTTGASSATEKCHYSLSQETRRERTDFDLPLGPGHQPVPLTVTPLGCA